VLDFRPVPDDRLNLEELPNGFPLSRPFGAEFHLDPANPLSKRLVADQWSQPAILAPDVASVEHARGAVDDIHRIAEELARVPAIAPAAPRDAGQSVFAIAFLPAEDGTGRYAAAVN
jgi:hypothetical protein